tara:strand:- start:530 stop:1249 length:720 start_codon:yes stop_codon:yes gene_type:complete
MKSISDEKVIQAQESLKTLSAKERLQWACSEFKGSFALTTSFGIQSSVLLHMLHSIDLEESVPVIWIDTGYLPKETYIYAKELTNLFKLNLQIFQSSISPARMEALFGKLWETNKIEDLEKYNEVRKIKPLENAFKSLNISCWASGVRGDQTKNRENMNIIGKIRGRFSLRPLLDWDNKKVFYYMKKYDLPQHPLFQQGYSTVGDWHSSAPDGANAAGRETRFGGLKQECGIHLENKEN